MAIGFVYWFAVTLPAEHRATPAGQPRARGLGLPFAGRPGRWNAITDVPGVEVGYVTLIQGDHVRTGVTAIHPRGPAGTGDPGHFTTMVHQSGSAAAVLLPARARPITLALP